MGKNIFKRRSHTWTIVYAGKIVEGVKDSLGMRDIAYLLEHPNKPIDSVLLYIMSNARLDPQAVDKLRKNAGRAEDLGYKGVGSLQKMTGEKALCACFRRLDEIRDEKEEVGEADYSMRLADLNTEEEGIKKWINQVSYGRGRGRAKIKTFESNSTRACKAVHRRVDTAKKNIQEFHEEAYNHFDSFITCGTVCTYAPDCEITWVVK
jgi:hypothetical protein